ncbi:calcium activated cation channel [Coprinopsis cinerea AmutBmut pab1-1]|nr:calcium activated cation channel [Coprinopsis cinerea AmutBmut pab1-1]
MSEAQTENTPLLSQEVIEDTKVYPLIHMIRADVIHYIDTPLSYDTLLAPDLNYTLVRPLVEKYTAIQESGNKSVVFCLLLNRVHFSRDDNPTTATLSNSRAALCEILATRTFRHYANSMLDLTLVLTTVWPVYSGADPKLLARAQAERDEELEDRVGNAIEMAILGKAKRFIKSSSCQKVIQAIWTGKCVYQAESTHSILSDTYKRNPIHFYDPHKAPLLDHYRLKVPFIRSVLEYTNFLILFILYVIAIEVSTPAHFNTAEICFIIYALGFTLEKLAAMQEHGIKVYFNGTWNAFDLAFVTTYAVYIMLRVYGVYYHKGWAKALGIDVLALIACMLFPRLAFVTFKDSLMVLSLRAMIVQFTFLMCIAIFCFTGFLYALWTLARNQAGYSAGQISWWMLDLWFGLDASGFDNATKFHPVLGPILMVTYACLSNTLLLTVLVSILSNTFATINEDAAAEAMFRKAVSTIEGVKADSLFSYQPPINLLALCIMLPSSYLLSPRWFHKVNVFMIRLTNFPLLLMISFYERQSQKAGSVSFSETVGYLAEKVYDTLPRSLKRFGLFEGFAGSGSDIDAIFEIEEEFDSALDTNDGESDGRPFFRQWERKKSDDAPFFRVGQSPQRSPRSSPQYPAPTGKRSSLSPPRAPRLRMDSLMPSKPQSGLGTAPFSPLAQVFKPVVVDTGTVIEELGETGQTLGESTAISYGPASRRRFSSIVQGKRPSHEALRQQAQTNAALRRNFPVPPPPQLSRSPSSPPAVERAAVFGDRPLTTSPPRGGEGKPIDLEAAATHEGLDVLAKKMVQMEERQQRIEELLTRIADNLRTHTGSP